MPVNFYELIGPGGRDEARAVFERMLIQLLRVKYPATGIAANPGDWGIDAFVGELDGTVSIWQSKYFIDGFAEAQEKQVRESFNSAVKAAAENGYKIDAWTLCVPVEPDAHAAKWWARWHKLQQKATGIRIELWSGSVLETLLLAPEAAHVFREYFPKSAQSLGSSPLHLRELPDSSRYDETLFIRQLHEAAIYENRSARQAFFNYELLSREVADKALPGEMEALRDAQAEAHALWEIRFVNATPELETGRLPGLHGDVMKAIEVHHQHAGPSILPLNVVHRFGGMHQIVEDSDAGWVSHFRDIAAKHHG